MRQYLTMNKIFTLSFSFVFNYQMSYYKIIHYQNSCKILTIYPSSLLYQHTRVPVYLRFILTALRSSLSEHQISLSPVLYSRVIPYPKSGLCEVTLRSSFSEHQMYSVTCTLLKSNTILQKVGYVKRL